MKRKPRRPIPPIVALKLAAQREGKLVDLQPRRYRRWPLERLINRLEDIDAIADVPLPIYEAMSLAAEYAEIEDELERR